MFASFLEEGSITMLSFAFRIVTIPLCHVGAVGAVPAVLLQLERRGPQRPRRGDPQGLLATLLFLVPATVVLCSFPEAVVAVLLERGEFGAAQTQATASLMVIYALGLPAMGLALLWGAPRAASGSPVPRSSH